MNTKHTKHKNTKTNKVPKRMILIPLGLLLVLIIASLLFIPTLFKRAESSHSIKIPVNATEQNITDSLTKYYGDSYANSVMKLMKLRNVDFSKRHGAYTIEKGETALHAMTRLSGGAQTPVTVTINGFRSLDNLFSKVSQKFDFPADSLANYVINKETLKKYDLTPQEALALFIDDSYEFYWSASPTEIIDKIGKNYLSIWDEQRRQKAAELGRTPAQIMILASITDEETNNVAEKGTIGRLYINRLNKNMRLQSDPTVRFALNDFTIKRVKAEHLKVESPYNTYRVAGLPPGPIRTTSKQTIDEILNSQPSNYLYMCAKEDFSGSHNFATTFEEHRKNATNYQRALNERGIK